MGSIYTLIGLSGVTTVLLAYGMMTAGKWPAHAARYQWLNVLGTAGILVSLIDAWNLPAFIANAAWIAIGMLSLVRIYHGESSLRGHGVDATANATGDRPKQSTCSVAWPKWIASLCARNDGAKK